MELLTPSGWADYELIDTGNREKLERYGKHVLIRPEPQAVWSKAMTEDDWDKLADARFLRGKPTSPRSPVTTAPLHHCTTVPVTEHGSRKEDRGEWIRKPGMPDQWWIEYRYKEMQLKFRLGLTAFGHIGVFPEQAENWKFIYDAVRRTTTPQNPKFATRNPEREPERSEARRSQTRNAQPATRNPQPAPRILNLFAYTGGASLAARAAGAEVVHVDSVRQVISWSRENMEASGLDGIRWVAEDALKFVRREVKRGNRYHGIILDPPAYGRGPEGEKWILEDSMDEMISLCAELMSLQSAVGSPQPPFLIPHSSFLILSLYSMGFSSLIGESLLRSRFGPDRKINAGEFCFTDRAGRRLPLGTFARI